MIRCEVEESDTMKIDSSTDLELVLIEELWNAPHCESNHVMVSCTHKPVAIWLATCRPPLMVCSNAREYIFARLAESGHGCSGCRQPITECWSLTPLPAS